MLIISRELIQMAKTEAYEPSELDREVAIRLMKANEFEDSINLFGD
jgi:hypothetical protein